MQDKRLSVLIIEDQQVFRSLALQVFEGCEKISAVTGAEGIAKFKEFNPDITLLDIGLPDKNGLDVLPDIIRYNPEAFVIMLTVSRVSSDVKLAKERGAAGYIIKPFTYQKVASSIAKYMEYKAKLQAMTDQERASKIVNNLKIEALHDDLNRQLNDSSAKTNALKHSDTIVTLLNNWKILFCDNFLTNRERAKTQLAKLGCQVDVAETAADIINKTASNTYNIILIDAKLDGISGYEIAKTLRNNENAANIKGPNRAILIAMVDDSYELERNLWQKAQMNDFIKKPASFSRLRDIINIHAKHYLTVTGEEFVN